MDEILAPARHLSAVRIPATLGRARHPATIERILASAERIFAERGLAGARTDEIARAAHVNKALLYYYFRSKEELHLAVLDSLLRKLRDTFDAASQPSALPSRRLLAFVNAYFDFMLHHPNYPRLIQREVMERGKRLPWMARNYFRPLQRQISRSIEAGIASGAFRRVDADQTAMTVTAMVISYFAAAPVLSQILGRDALHPQAVATRRRAILDFLEHGLFRRPQQRKAARAS